MQVRGRLEGGFQGFACGNSASAQYAGFTLCTCFLPVLCSSRPKVRNCRITECAHADKLRALASATPGLLGDTLFLDGMEEGDDGAYSSGDDDDGPHKDSGTDDTGGRKGFISGSHRKLHKSSKAQLGRTHNRGGGPAGLPACLCACLCACMFIANMRAHSSSTYRWSPSGVLRVQGAAPGA